MAVTLEQLVVEVSRLKRELAVTTDLLYKIVAENGLKLPESDITV